MKQFSELVDGLLDFLADVMVFVGLLYLLHNNLVPSQGGTNIFLILSAAYLILRTKKS